MTSAKKAAEPILNAATPQAWHAWLASHHATSTGVLLRIANGKRTTMTYAQALEVALAWGWVDSQKSALDETAWIQRFTPRTKKSPWSKINRAKAEALIAAKKMETPGLAAVEQAKRDGRWERAYDGARTAAVPDDLGVALSKNARARAFFEKLDGANRYAILYRIQTAKKPETRAERVARFVVMCERGETIHPPRKSARGKVARRKVTATKKTVRVGR
jgi:uncharacterized protein YdeI (YjbR/CyaY-like superfamily)